MRPKILSWTRPPQPNNRNLSTLDSLVHLWLEIPTPHSPSSPFIIYTGQVDYPSSCYLWQETLDVLGQPCVLPPTCAVLNLRTGQVRLPELDKKVVELQPIPRKLFSDGLPDADTDVREDRLVR